MTDMYSLYQWVLDMELGAHMAGNKEASKAYGKVACKILSFRVNQRPHVNRTDWEW